jgi:transposase
MNADTIVAIDLGRYKSVACTYSRATRAHAFRTIDTTPEDLGRLLARHPGAVVVVEACANAGWVHDRAVAAGHVVKVANTAAESWKFQHLKRKTDKDDVVRLAELEAIGQLPTVCLPDPSTRQRRMLIALRQELVGRRVAAQNRIRALFDGVGLPTPRGHRAWTAAGLAGIEGHARPLADCGAAEPWRGMLGLALAEYRAVEARIGEVEARLDSPVANFFVSGNSADRGGIRVAAKDADGDTKADLAVGSGEGDPAKVRVYLGKDFSGTTEPAAFQDLAVFGGAAQPGGIFVG